MEDEEIKMLFLFSPFWLISSWIDMEEGENQLYKWNTISIFYYRKPIITN